MEILNNYFNLAESLVIIVIAIWGFIRWRKQFVWTRRYDLRTKVMANMYSIERALRKIRNELGNSSEGNNPAEILKKRYGYFREEFDKIDRYKDEIKASLGDSFIDPYNEMIKKIDALRNAARRLSSTGIELEQRKELESIVYRGSDPNKDEYAADIRRIVVGMQRLFDDKLKTGPL